MKKPVEPMNNMHPLHPCQLCDVRMAVPDWPVCTICDAFLIAALVPNSPEGIEEVKS